MILDQFLFYGNDLNPIEVNQDRKFWLTVYLKGKLYYLQKKEEYEEEDEWEIFKSEFEIWLLIEKMSENG